MNPVNTELVLFVDVVISLDDDFIGVQRLRLIEDKITAGPRKIGRRIQIEKPDAVRVHRSGGDDAVRKHQASRRILRPPVRCQVGEIAVEILLRRHGPRVGTSRAQPLEILRHEKEQFFALSIDSPREQDRPSQVPAEIVPPQLRLHNGIERAGVQGIVTKVLIYAAVETLCSTAQRKIHNGAGTGAGLGAEVTGADPEFAQRIRVDVHEIVAAPAVVFVVRPVEIPRDGVASAAVDRLRVVRYSIPAKQAETALISGGHAGNQRQ